jgi:hypothetical protein
MDQEEELKPKKCNAIRERGELHTKQRICGTTGKELLVQS